MVFSPCWWLQLGLKGPLRVSLKGMHLIHRSHVLFSWSGKEVREVTDHGFESCWVQNNFFLLCKYPLVPKEPGLLSQTGSPVFKASPDFKARG